MPGSRIRCLVFSCRSFITEDRLTEVQLASIVLCTSNVRRLTDITRRSEADREQGIRACMHLSQQYDVLQEHGFPDWWVLLSLNCEY